MKRTRGNCPTSMLGNNPLFNPTRSKEHPSSPRHTARLLQSFSMGSSFLARLGVTRGVECRVNEQGLSAIAAIAMQVVVLLLLFLVHVVTVTVVVAVAAAVAVAVAAVIVAVAVAVAAAVVVVAAVNPRGAPRKLALLRFP